MAFRPSVYSYLSRLEIGSRLSVKTVEDELRTAEVCVGMQSALAGMTRSEQGFNRYTRARVFHHCHRRSLQRPGLPAALPTSPLRPSSMSEDAAAESVSGLPPDVLPDLVG